MHYFFPAWYESQDSFKVRRIPWYEMRQKIEFDETIHQVRIFREQEQFFRLMLLAYHPHVRYFLHRYDLYEASYFSLFDDLQGIHEWKAQIIQIEDLNFDEWCDFVYTPFLISVYRHDQRIAQIEFSQEGLITHVNYFVENRVDHVDIFDDRGFLSSVIYYREGNLWFQEYLNPTGDWQFREYFQENGRIEINSTLENKFMKLTYASLAELVSERLRLYMGIHMQESDQIILAAHRLHETVVLPLLPEKVGVVITTFVERLSSESLLSLPTSLEQSRSIMVDRLDSTQYLMAQLPQYHAKIHYLPPYDTRLNLGMSQQKKIEKIYFQINPEDFALEQVTPIIRYVSGHANTTLTIGIVNAAIKPFEELINRWIEETALEENLMEDIDNPDIENRFDEDKLLASRISFAQFMNEVDLLRELEYTRLVVDVSSTPNVYTQIASISAGIPQINIVSTEYVTHQENGYILDNLNEFELAADYYLSQLQHWNEALIHSIHKIRENTGAAFIKKWKTWTESR